MESSEEDGLFAKIAKALAQVEKNEIKATVVATLFVFVLMSSWYVLRPVRDALPSDWTDSELSFLWNINFFVSAVIVSVYGFAVSKIKLRYIVPSMYAFFAISFVAFYFGAAFIKDAVLVDKLFYLWSSVFALFHVSVFWTLMADTFNKEQARRLFGIIFVGASAGGLVGPLLPVFFSEKLGLDTLMLIASLGLLSVIPMVFYLYHLKTIELGNDDVSADTSAITIGGNWWQGFRSFVTSPFLLG